ncbi:snaclec coagulation factor IX/factor X-binding protein subunit A-like [Anneissia japonica]|uniref:snaclec coagulation factor IX/factor X-binding protein subunit A-like n=1 Tax=Anneissia japonica TaxID=1529436 RepID=UPI0014255393|nr:snaclec coagulation factor IX/factor X-binding protein subunit A-like [Anneissia japonica]
MGIVLLLGIFIAVAASPSDGAEYTVQVCPEYWVPFGNKCYRFFASLKTWDEAEKDCSSSENSQSHLVSIESEDENQFVATLWQTYNNELVGFGFTYWIGLKKSGTTWSWSDNSPYQYNNWSTGEPNNPETENCVTQWNAENSYLTWNNLRCDYKLPYTCEI